MPRLRRHLCRSASAFLLAAFLTGCGGSSHSSDPIARVGDAVITKGDLEHRVDVISVNRTSHLSAEEANTLRRDALEYLIRTQWILQEAPSEHRPLSPTEVDRRLAEKERSLFPGGSGERNQFLDQSGQRVADLKQNLELELAMAKLHHGISQSIWPVTDTEVAAYYRSHLHRFGLPETREIWTIDRKTRAAAAAVKRRVEGGVRFGSFARTETATGPRGIGGHPPEGAFEEAIDAAKPHILLGPVKYRADYFIFELKRLTQPSYQPLVQVFENIKQTMTKERERVALKRFVREWRLRWAQMTECEPGYVVPKCREYSGPATHENPLAIE
jgi:hypothetical protein